MTDKRKKRTRELASKLGVPYQAADNLLKNGQRNSSAQTGTPAVANGGIVPPEHGDPQPAAGDRAAETLVAEIRDVLGAHPELTSFGFRSPSNHGSGYVSEARTPAAFQAERAELLSAGGLEEVRACLAYLKLVRATGSARPRKDRRSFGSYGMKHEVERWLRSNGKEKHIANGAFIAAAVLAGVPIYREDVASPNCLIGVEEEDVRALGEGIDPLTLRKKTAFVKWLFAQADRDNPIGDLARDSREDLKFPRGGNKSTIGEYLSQYDSHVTDAFEDAKREYRER
jgi:hypothetical protein